MVCMATGKTENWTQDVEKKDVISWSNEVIPSQVIEAGTRSGEWYVDMPSMADKSEMRASGKEDARSKAVSWMQDHPYPGVEDWKKRDLKSLKDSLGGMVRVSDPEEKNPNRFIAEDVNSGEKYYVYKNEEAVSDEAERHVKRDLERRPEMFNTAFLQDFAYMTDNDKRLQRKEQARIMFEGMNEEELKEEAEARGIDTDQSVTEIRSELEMQKAEELKSETSDPFQWFAGYLGMPEDKVMEQDAVRIDVDEASETAVRRDGAGHYLSDHGRMMDLGRGNGEAYRVQ